MSEQAMQEYLKVERERMEAATFFCRVCRSWELKASHQAHERVDHCTHLDQAWCDCDWCRVIAQAAK